jgi:hypothetical protein
MAMEPATLSAVSALAGSGIGALASVTTSWLTHHFQSRSLRLGQEGSRRERLFSDFVDQASQTYADGIVRDRLDGPDKLVPLYSTINKLRLFATPETVQSAEAVLEHIVQTYNAPPSSLEESRSTVAAHDILRTFAEACRHELKTLR